MTPQTGAHPRVEVLSVRVPRGERRTPVALAAVAIGPVTFTMTVARGGKGRKQALTVRPPEVAADRSAGVALPAALLAEVEAACIAAARHDPDASAVLLRHPMPDPETPPTDARACGCP